MSLTRKCALCGKKVLILDCWDHLWWAHCRVEKDSGHYFTQNFTCKCGKLIGSSCEMRWHVAEALGLDSRKKLTIKHAESHLLVYMVPQ